MSLGTDAPRPRILVVDDNAAIHGDFRRIFRSDGAAQPVRPEFEIDFASHEQEGFALLERALTEGRPYALAFIDMRAPPDWQGVHTASRIGARDAHIQLVLCTAHADCSWSLVRERLGSSGRLLMLKRPLHDIEALQLADMLAHKWRHDQRIKRRCADLEQRVRDHARDLRESNERAEQLHRRLVMAGLQEKAALNTQSRNRLALETNLQQALRDSQLSVHYQPLVDIATRRVVSLEALVRWFHPQHGAISPGEFIPMAEESGLILPVGEFVLKSVCEQLIRWEQDDVPVVPVAVNISAVQLQRLNIRDFVAGILREAGIKPSLVALELTESAIITNATSHIAELQALRDMGIGIEIDDFGTGYSSLSYLKHLPIDTLKIDRTFISQIHINSQDEAIVNAILAMADCLGLKVTAEGVETTAQLDVLLRLGCEVAQGFFFSRPLTADKCCDLLRDLAQRPSFTETLRMQVASGIHGSPRYPAARKR
jgi:EAL domain-containing protein (putative c-di-GMP-specific phosphodiesterase class I)